MFSVLRNHTWTIRTALISLVAASALVAASPAHASEVGPISPESFTFDRASTDGSSLVLKAGESGDLFSQTTITSDWSRWPLKKGAKLTRSAYSVSFPDAVSHDSSSQWRYWSGQRTAEGPWCDGFWQDGATYTLVAADTCIDWLQVDDSVWADNTTDSNQTFTSNAGGQVLKNGKSIVSGTGVESTAFAQVHKRDVSSVTLNSSETNLNFTFRACIDESLLTDASQDLTMELVVTRNGTPLTQDEDFFAYEYSGYGDTETMTYTTPSATDFDAENGTARQNLEANVNVSVYPDATGTFTGTLDVVNGSDQSVLEECPIDGVAAWPTVSYTNHGTPDITQNSRSLPTNVSQSNDDFDLYQSNPDGFGGQFQWSYNAESGADLTGVTATLVHVGPTGPTNAFNGAGYIDLTAGAWGEIDLGRYDVNGAKWYAITNSGSNWIVNTGSMSASSYASTTYTNKNLGTLCAKGFTPVYLSGIPAPTATPLATLMCNSKGQVTSTIVSLVNGAVKPTVVAQLGSGTAKKPCVVPSQGTNPSASAPSDIAVAFYTRTGGKDADGYCGSVGASISARAITSITQGGVATTVKLTGDPWGDGEPQVVELAPANSVGSQWIGLEYAQDDPWSSSYPTHPFTMTASAVSKSSSSVTDDADVDFGDWIYTQPIKKVSDTSWLVSVYGTLSFDGENTGKYSVGVLNVTTGQITVGDVGTMSDFGYYSGRIASRLSVKPGTGAYWYVVTDDTHYTVSGWTSGA